MSRSPIVPPAGGADPGGPKPASAQRARTKALYRKRLGELARFFLVALEVLLICGLAFELVSLVRQTRPVRFTLRYLVPGQEDVVETVPAGEFAPLHAPVELEGYTFLYWERADGTPETESVITPQEDTVYTARYALAFPSQRHITYLHPDENGVVGVNRPVTVRELVITIYELLDLDRVGKGTFEDVPRDDSCFTAAATLKDLGILKGDMLYPDEKLTRGELLELLSRFYPAASVSFSFPDLEPDDDAWPLYCLAAERGWIDAETGWVDGGPPAPAKTVTRGELARVLNRVLGRAPRYRQEDAAVGMILDCPVSHPWYADVAEAAIAHTYTVEEGFERWLSSEPLPAHEPGLFFAGVRLHCILDNGVQAANTSVDGRDFNECGEITSGNAELDLRLQAVLEETVDPSAMTQTEMLRAVYDYVARNFSRSLGAVYPLGTDDWAAEAALRMLEEGEGSSYGYAALFYELARFVGAKPTLLSGAVYGEQKQFESPDGTRVQAPEGYEPHAWVELRDQGIAFIYDAEMEARYDGQRSFYRVYDPVRWQKGYRSNFS